jgi:hypothetical protein
MSSVCSSNMDMRRSCVYAAAAEAWKGWAECLRRAAEELLPPIPALAPLKEPGRGQPLATRGSGALSCLLCETLLGDWHRERSSPTPMAVEPGGEHALREKATPESVLVWARLDLLLRLVDDTKGTKKPVPFALGTSGWASVA